MGARWLCERRPPSAPGEALSMPTTLPRKERVPSCQSGWPFTGLEAQSMVFLSKAV